MQSTGPKKAEFYASTRDWPGYFRAVAGKGPRETLVFALDAFEREDAGARRRRVALDIGCGEGRDTREILRRSGATRWTVMANDDCHEAADLLFGSLGARDGARVLFAGCHMEDLPRQYAGGVRAGGSKRLARSVDLVNASFSLPFCRPEAFPELWAWIVRVIGPGGRFAGQLFGDRDDWASLPDRSHHTRAEVERMLEPFEVEKLNEEEKDSNDAGADPKHWHVFHVVARKK